MALAFLTGGKVAELEYQDIQGLVLSGYGHLPCARYLLLRVVHGPAACDWVSRIVDDVTTAERKQDGASVNIAFTHGGLARLGLDADTLRTFPRAFSEGMATPHRSRILGDAREDEPVNWNWGGTDPAKAVDILLLLFAVDEGELDLLLTRHRAAFSQGGIAEVLALETKLPPDSREHFGFADGVGQPAIENTSPGKKAAARNLLRAGEILMGHVNTYDKPADSPTVHADRDPLQLLSDAPLREGAVNGQPRLRDLGHNGTYLVFRQLAQKVADLYHFLDDATRTPSGQLDPDASGRLAAKFVGRWPSGAPLVLAPDKDDPSLADADDFGYFDQDPRGFACPLGSHIRRSNPRDSLGPNTATALASANRHRILRRGRPYGERLENPRVDDGAERGLHFICLNSDIERQFEFVQQTWINNPVFGGLNGEVDPLVGYVDKGDAIMTVPADPVRTRVHNLQRFVSVKGGAYFFLPGIRALRYLAGTRPRAADLTLLTR
jgi:Dyp-type peroxidase family